MFWWSRHYQEVPWGALDSVCLEVEPREIKCHCDFASKSWIWARDLLRLPYLLSRPATTWLWTPVKQHSSHCGRGQRGVTKRNVDRLKCDMKCVSNIKPREGVHIIQPILQLMNGCYLHSYYLSCIQICEKAAKRNNKTREKPTLFL